MLSRVSRGGATLSLKALVALALGAMAALAIGALGFSAERSLSREAKRHIQERLSELAFQMGYRLDRSMFERFRDIQVASSLDTLRSGSADARRQLLERLKETYSDYAWIGLADTEGRVLVSTGRILEGEDVAQRPWFVAGLAGPFVGDVHEALLLEKLLPRQGDEPLRFVDLAAPVLGANGATIGVLATHLNWTWAAEILSSILRNGSAGDGIEVFLINREGRVILGPPGSFGEPSPCASPAPGASEGLPGGATVCADGRSYLVGHAANQGYRFYPGLGWQILIRQPVEIALGPVAELQRELLLAGIVLALLFMTAGWFLAAWIAQPLRAVAAAAERLRLGERSASFPASHRFAEVASLTASLASLLGELARIEAGLRQSAAENERSQRFLRAIVENMQDALFVNEGGRIVFANKACLRLVGAATADQFIGTSPLDLIQADYRPLVEERIRSLGEPGAKVPTIEERIVGLDGRIIDVEVTAAAFLDDGDPAILVIMRDLSERKVTERQLAHAQRMETVGHLTGGMAHDFNNLLTVIIGNLDLLEESLKDRPRESELAGMALSAGLRGAELTRQLLAFSRQQSLDPQVFHMNELVAGTTDLLRRTLGEGIDVRMQLADDLWPALADPSQLESAMTNLAINARDAMQEGGILTIETANKHLDAKYASENLEVEPGEYVMLAVSDTGTGIPPEVLARVFEPFFTTKRDGKGSGLGLSMIYGFARQSRGHVKIYSEPGHGTTVRLYLPRAPADRQLQTAEASVETLDVVAGATILVVEDKPEVRRVVSHQLAELGYQVIEADNVAAALRIVEGGERIDLLFTDIVMPGGKTGVDLAREARQHRPALKVVFTSGFAEILNGNEDEARALGALLSKPYRKYDLARQIQETLKAPAVS
jgi:PAS domain S-box-containing protein